MAPVRDHVDHVAGLYRAHVAQGHEQPDLEFVGVHDSRDDLAARHFLTDAPHAIGHHAVERSRQARARQLIVGLRQRRAGDLQVGLGEVTVRLRLVDVEA